MIVLKLNQKAFQEIVQYSVKASVCAQAIQMQKMGYFYDISHRAQMFLLINYDDGNSHYSRDSRDSWESCYCEARSSQ